MLAHKQATAHSGSHDQSEISVGSCDGNHTDPQAALNKINAKYSDCHNRKSETPEPIASHTRQKTRRTDNSGNLGVGTCGNCVRGSDSSETSVPANQRGATSGDGATRAMR